MSPQPGMATRATALDLDGLLDALDAVPGDEPRAVQALIIGGSGMAYSVVAVEPDPVVEDRILLKLVPARPHTFWRDDEYLPVKSKGGAFTFRMRPGDPCRVAGLGRGGAAQSGWSITRVQRHVVTGEWQVEVVRNGKSRTVAGERIVYVRPKKKATS